MTPVRPGWERSAAYTASVDSRVCTQTGRPSSRASPQQPSNHSSWASWGPRCSSAWSSPTSPMATTRGSLASSRRSARSGPVWLSGWWPTAAQRPGLLSAHSTTWRLVVASTPMAIRSVTPAARASARTSSTSPSTSSRWTWVSTSLTGSAEHLDAWVDPRPLLVEGQYRGRLQFEPGRHDQRVGQLDRTARPKLRGPPPDLDRRGHHMTDLGQLPFDPASWLLALAVRPHKSLGECGDRYREIAT